MVMSGRKIVQCVKIVLSMVYVVICVSSGTALKARPCVRMTLRGFKIQICCITAFPVPMITQCESINDSILYTWSGVTEIGKEI